MNNQEKSFQNHTIKGHLKQYFAKPLGFAFFMAWFYCTFYSCLLITNLSMPRSSERYWSVALLAAAIGCLVTLFLLKRKVQIANKPVVGFSGAAAAAVGTVLIYLGFSGAIIQLYLVILGVVLAGGGYVILVLTWGAVLSSYEESMIEFSVPLSFALSILLYFPLVAFKGALAMIVVMALPLVSVLFAFSKQEAQDGQRTIQEPCATASRASFAATFKEKTPGMTEVAILLATLWFNFAFFRSFMAPDYPSNRFIHYLFAFVCALVIALTILVFTIRNAHALDFSIAFRWVLPIICTAYTLFVLLDGAFREIAYACNFLGLVMMQLYFWIVSAKQARRASVDPLIIFSVFLLALSFGGCLGGSAGLWIQTFASEGIAFKILPVVMTGVVAVVMVFRRGSERCTKPHSLSQGSQGDSAEGRPAFSMDGTRMFNDGISMQAAVIADRYLLSARECEVLTYLLAGRSRPFIRDKLFISLNTVNTHIKRIYTKTDIHSIQDLLDFAQNKSMQDDENDAI